LSSSDSDEPVSGPAIPGLKSKITQEDVFRQRKFGSAMQQMAEFAAVVVPVDVARTYDGSSNASSNVMMTFYSSECVTLSYCPCCIACMRSLFTARI
jgi:hypothetical protein